jgi:predicted GNAT family N-acyltransferase
MPNIRIEAMQAGEEKAVIELIRKNYDKNVAEYSSKEGNEIFYDYLNIDDFIVRNQHGHFTLVAKENGFITGIIEVRNNDHISLFFVKNELRGRGIGRQLFNKAVEAIKANSKTTEITVNSSPNSVMLYQKLGFEKVSEERSFKGLRYIPMKARIRI